MQVPRCGELIPGEAQTRCGGAARLSDPGHDCHPELCPGHHERLPEGTETLQPCPGSGRTVPGECTGKMFREGEQHVMEFHLLLHILHSCALRIKLKLSIIIVDDPSLPGPSVAPAGHEDQVSGSRPEDPSHSAAVPHSVRLCHLPQPAGVPQNQREGLRAKLRYNTEGSEAFFALCETVRITLTKFQETNLFFIMVLQMANK